MKNEFYDSALQKKIYTSLEDLQTYVDSWLRHYNRERPHSGKYCYGETSMQTFRECKSVAVDKSNNRHTIKLLSTVVTFTTARGLKNMPPSD